MLQQAAAQASHMLVERTVTPAESVISRLLPVASPQLVRTTSLVSCPLSTLPDLEMPLVEIRLVLSAALSHQFPLRSHLPVLVSPNLQAPSCPRLLRQLRMFLPQPVSTAALLTQMATRLLVVTVLSHQHFQPTTARPAHLRLSLAAQVLKPPPLVVISHLPRLLLWASMVTTRLSLLLPRIKAVSRLRSLRVQAP